MKVSDRKRRSRTSHSSSGRLKVALVALLTGVALAPGALVTANSPDSLTESTDPSLLAAAITEGRAIYAYNCSVCHGPTGGGMAEARLAFPPGERNCAQCHKANNPVVMPLTKPIKDNDMFPVGVPPALRVAGELTGGNVPLVLSAPPAALFNYVRATMPRYHPGRQTDVEYWLLTALLLDMNDRDADALGAARAAASLGWVAAE